MFSPLQGWPSAQTVSHSQIAAENSVLLRKQQLLNQLSWDKFIYPQNHKTIYHILVNFPTFIVNALLMNIYLPLCCCFYCFCLLRHLAHVWRYVAIFQMGSNGISGTIKLIERIPFLSGKMPWTLDLPYGLTNTHINPPGTSNTPTLALMLNPLIIEKSQEDECLKLSSNFNAKCRSIYPTKLPIGGFVESQKNSSDVHFL